MSASPAIPITQWALDLQQALQAAPGPLRRVMAVGEVDSTQDEARRANARPGQVIVAWRQTSGRGRLGRAWEDTGEDGIAMTMVVQRDRPERLAIAGAVGVCLGLERLCGERAKVMIKWPNDIMAGAPGVAVHRKLSGILIEQVDDHALIGVGVNVRQTAASWPEAIAAQAVSLLELGVDVDRLHAMIFVLTGMQIALSAGDDDLARLFAERDGLTGKAATFRSGEREIRGLVDRIDPMKGLALETSTGKLWLPAATTTVLERA